MGLPTASLLVLSHFPLPTPLPSPLFIFLQALLLMLITPTPWTISPTPMISIVIFLLLIPNLHLQLNFHFWALDPYPQWPYSHSAWISSTGIIPFPPKLLLLWVCYLNQWPPPPTSCLNQQMQYQSWVLPLPDHSPIIHKVLTNLSFTFSCCHTGIQANVTSCLDSSLD